MTGWWPIGIKDLYKCDEYGDRDDLAGQITPGLCCHWVGCRCDLGKECPWSGLPPLESESNE